MTVVPNAVAQGKFYLSVNAGPSLAALNATRIISTWRTRTSRDFPRAAGNFLAQTEGVKKMPSSPRLSGSHGSLNGFERYYKGGLSTRSIPSSAGPGLCSEIARIRASGGANQSLLPARRHGIAFMKRYALGVGIPVIGPASRSARRAPARRRRGARSQTLHRRRPISTMPEQGVRRGLQGGLRPPAVDLCGAASHGRSACGRCGRASVKDADTFRAALAAAQLDRCAATSSSTPTTMPFTTSMSAR